MKINDIHIKMFRAGSGDCILLEFEKADFRILIDGGFVETYQQELRPYLRMLSKKGKHINLLIISHIDQDHINGIKALLKENENSNSPKIIQIDEVWFNGFRHTEVKRDKKDISHYEEAVLRTLANKNSYLKKADGSREISYMQGNSVAELLIKNNYHWNTSVKGSSISTDTIRHKAFGNITFQILNPTQKILNELAEDWLWMLKAKCKQVIISDNSLFDDAFEGAYIGEHEDWLVVKKDISNDSENKEYNWKLLVEEDDEKADTKLSNRSSIAVLISYKGINLLFPGDCAIHFFEDRLPDKIDIVKLPHHGSGKNTDKNFIRNTYVSYYLISTNGKHQEHPSPKIIANILTKAPGHPMIIKNYDVPILEGIGKLEREEIG